jgi:hypothetical protein
MGLALSLLCDSWISLIELSSRFIYLHSLSSAVFMQSLMMKSWLNIQLHKHRLPYGNINTTPEITHG